MQLLRLLPLLLILGGCTAHHQIAGSNYGWQGDSTQVVHKVETETFEIKQVRVVDTDCVSSFRDHLEFNGELSAAAIDQFQALAESTQQCRSLGGVSYPQVVFMNGQGGTLADGYRLGELLSSNQMHAIITGDQRCSGACAIGFLGAKHKSIHHQGRLVLNALQSPRTLAEGCFSKQDRTFIKRYLIRALGRSQGLALYDLALDRCGSTNVWEINRDLARIYRLTAL